MDYQLEKGGMPLLGEVGEAMKEAQLLKIKAKVPGTWAMECELMIV